jgi:hypothetical protein
VFFWTNSLETSRNVSPILRILVIGYAFNSLVVVPYALQLAYEWTSLALFQNIIAIIILSPLILFFTSIWGNAGSASVWLILNLAYLLISMPIMYKKLLSTEKWTWYKLDIIKPMLISGSVVAMGKILKNTLIFNNLVFIMILSLFVLTLTALSTNYTNKQIISIYKLIKNKNNA